MDNQPDSSYTEYLLPHEEHAHQFMEEIQVLLKAKYNRLQARITNKTAEAIDMGTSSTKERMGEHVLDKYYLDILKEVVSNGERADEESATMTSVTCYIRGVEDDKEDIEGAQKLVEEIASKHNGIVLKISIEKDIISEQIASFPSTIGGVVVDDPTVENIPQHRLVAKTSIVFI